MWWNEIEISKEFQELLKDESQSNEFISNTKTLLKLDEKEKTINLFSDPLYHKRQILIGTLKLSEEVFDLCSKLIVEKDYKVALLQRKNESELIRSIANSLLNGTNIISKET